MEWIESEESFRGLKDRMDWDEKMREEFEMVVRKKKDKKEKWDGMKEGMKEQKELFKRENMKSFTRNPVFNLYFANSTQLV